ncbi:MAG: helix-turn-helix domain-containing protein [Ruthenibacterium lactatiformans]
MQRAGRQQISPVARVLRAAARSFREYVNALRLDCARDLLAATELSMLEVSMESGFDSLRTFNRVFQERFRQAEPVPQKPHRRPVGRTGRAAAQRRVTPCALGKKAMALEVF